MKRREHGCRFEAILLLLVSVLLLAREAKFAQALSAEEAKQTITVVDSVGRQVEVPVPVDKVFEGNSLELSNVDTDYRLMFASLVVRTLPRE